MGSFLILVYVLMSSSILVILLMQSSLFKAIVMLPLSAFVKMTSGLFLIKVLQVLSSTDNLGFEWVFDNKVGKEPING